MIMQESTDRQTTKNNQAKSQESEKNKEDGNSSGKQKGWQITELSKETKTQLRKDKKMHCLINFEKINRMYINNTFGKQSRISKENSHRNTFRGETPVPLKKGRSNCGLFGEMSMDK